jgi:hypothetical protein
VDEGGVVADEPSPEPRGALDLRISQRSSGRVGMVAVPRGAGGWWPKHERASSTGGWWSWDCYSCSWPVRCEVAVERLSIEGHGVRAETSDWEILRAQAANLATRASEALELWSEAPGEVARFLSDQPIRTRSALSFG